MLADWQELRKNTKKPKFVGLLVDLDGPLCVDSFIKNFQSSFEVALNT